MAAPSDPGPAEPDTDDRTPAADLCHQARDLAEHGHLKRAARLYEGALDQAAGDDRARAALGLAVVRHDLGEPEAAHRAAETAIATGHPELAPRAAVHLAMSHEQRHAHPEAARAWRRVLSLDSTRYAPVAHYGLARIAEETGCLDEADEHWQHVYASDDAEIVVEAAGDHARRLLARGDLDAAARVLTHARELRDDPPLRLLTATTHLERAVTELNATLVDGEPDPETGRTDHPETLAVAVELLARLLAVRGDPEGAVELWHRGLQHPDADVSRGVHTRLRRGFLEMEPQSGEERAGSDAVEHTQWWDPFVESAVASSSTPMLTGELFAALTRLYTPLAAALASGEGDPTTLRRLVLEAVRTPSDYVWGRALHDDFRERMRLAAGSPSHVLPQDWPDSGT